VGLTSWILDEPDPTNLPNPSSTDVRPFRTRHADNMRLVSQSLAQIHSHYGQSHVHLSRLASKGKILKIVVKTLTWRMPNVQAETRALFHRLSDDDSHCIISHNFR
jgi:hypothetical protein